MVTVEGVARHESSHCFIAWYYGLSIGRVTISVDPLKEGRQGYCSAKDTREFPTAAGIYFTLAGAVIDDLYTGKHSTKGDIEFIRNSFCLSGDTLKMHEFFKVYPGADIESFYQEFKIPVLKLLRSRKGKLCINALSNKLINVGTLSGQAAVAILQDAWGKPLPAIALPAGEHGAPLTSKINGFDDLLYHIKFYTDAINADFEALSPGISENHERKIDALRKAVLQLNFLLSE